MNIIIICNDSRYTTNFTYNLSMNHNYTVINPTKLYPNKNFLETLIYVNKMRGYRFLIKRSFQKLMSVLKRYSTNNLHSVCKIRGIDFFNYKDLNDSNLLEHIKQINPDIICSNSLNHKVPDKIIKLARFFSVNIHPSLLPSYKGPSPIFWVLYNQEEYSGITIHELTSQYDDGKILFQKKYALGKISEKQLYDKSSKEAVICFEYFLNNFKASKKFEVVEKFPHSYYPRPTYKQRLNLSIK